MKYDYKLNLRVSTIDLDDIPYKTLKSYVDEVLMIADTSGSAFSYIVF